MSSSPFYPAKSPLPQKDGIDPVALILPLAGESPEDAYLAQPRRPFETFGAETVLDYMVARFYPHERELFAQRFEAGEVKDDTGQAVDPLAPLVGQKIWYYRQLPQEKPVPTDLPVLYEDDWLLVVDKPHFLNTAPNGSFLANTALTILRVGQNCPELVPAHRLDRLTAGVLIFAKRIDARGPLQTLFERGEITKTYEAVAPSWTDSGFSTQVGQQIQVESYIKTQHGQRQVMQLSAAEARAQGKSPNAQTLLTCLKEFELDSHQLEASHLPADFPNQLAHYLLEPLTGKTHQLRAHLWSLGAPILGDGLYPQDLGFAEDNPHLPLQLLCRSMSFTHPFTGEILSISSQRQLSLLPEEAKAELVSHGLGNDPK